jgi:hypothetical protein
MDVSYWPLTKLSVPSEANCRCIEMHVINAVSWGSRDKRRARYVSDIDCCIINEFIYQWDRRSSSGVQFSVAAYLLLVTQRKWDELVLAHQLY